MPPLCPGLGPQSIEAVSGNYFRNRHKRAESIPSLKDSLARLHCALKDRGIVVELTD